MADSEDKPVTETAAKEDKEDKETVSDDPVTDEKAENESKSEEKDSIPNGAESESKEKDSIPNGAESESKEKDPVLNGAESESKEKDPVPNEAELESKDKDSVEEIENEVENEEEEKMETEEKSETQSVTGVVFQFDENSILFEFSLRTFEDGRVNLEEDLIGEISPQKLVCRGSTIPKGTKSDKIAKFVQSGDEIRCQVEKNDDLKVFTYNEVEEEIGEDDEGKYFFFDFKVFSLIPVLSFPKFVLILSLQFILF